MTTWQPIETAPRDGTVVILCGGAYGGFPFSGQWELGPFANTDRPWLNVITGSRLYEHVPKKWMKIPDSTTSPKANVTAGDEGLWHFWNEKARNLAEENGRLRETNRKLHRRAQIGEAVVQCATDYLAGWIRISKRYDRRWFALLLARDLQNRVKKITDRFDVIATTEGSDRG